MDRREQVREAYERLGGNVSAVSRELGISRSTVHHHLKKLNMHGRPLAAGSVKARSSEKRELPSEGVRRYILTSAQNNTYVNERAWSSLMALVEHYEAELFIGTFSYNMNAYGKLAVKRGHAPSGGQADLWFDQRLMDYIEAGDDRDIVLAPGLMWCGRANIMPTASRPLSGFENYSGRQSGIFPHVKVSMESVASAKHEATKFNYTTGTITQRNYIQKKAGLRAEKQHSYGCLLVEVDSEGRWWARQVVADERGRMQDLDVIADGDKVTIGNRVEGITWGDIHEAKMDLVVSEVAWGEGGMMDCLRPRYQFMEDLIDFNARRHYNRNDPHRLYELFTQGSDSVEAEMQSAANFLSAAERPWCQTVVVDSNHDNDFLRWLREADYRMDPLNAEYFLEAQLRKYQSIRLGEDFHAVEWALRRAECPTRARFLREDESFVICKGARGGIECGMHGHLGVNGSRASPRSFTRLGRACNVAHFHSAGIVDDVYVAGMSGTLDQGYNKGPSSWSQSHIVTYPNGSRAIVTMWEGRWRA